MLTSTLFTLFITAFLIVSGLVLWESEKIIQEKKDNERGDKL